MNWKNVEFDCSHLEVRRNLLSNAQEIIKPKYWSIQSMKRGIALVEYAEGKYGYVDKYGKEYFVGD